jgi:hypothetical protein
MSLDFLLGEDDSPKLNEHQIAWLSKDWDKTKKLADSFKEKSANEFFYILNQINTQKKRINPEHMESYNQYAINSALSGHIDCSYHAYAMNLLGDAVSDQMHFDYLLHAVRSSKRYGGATSIVDPIESMVDEVFARAVGKYYQVNLQRAKEYIDEDFNPEQIGLLKKMLCPTIDESMVKEACSYAKKSDINCVLKSIEDWNK